MKKTLSVILLIVMLLTVATSVKAVSNSELASKLYALGAKYGMTSADKVKIDRYLADYPVSSAEADQVLAKANEATQLMESAGVTDYKKLSSEEKDQLKSLANEAASIVGVTLTYSDGEIDVYKDGKLIETLGSTSGGNLAYTGNDVNAVLVVSSVAVIALATIFVAKRKMANA